MQNLYLLLESTSGAEEHTMHAYTQKMSGRKSPQVKDDRFLRRHPSTNVLEYLVRYSVHLYYEIAGTAVVLRTLLVQLYYSTLLPLENGNL